MISLKRIQNLALHCTTNQKLSLQLVRVIDTIAFMSDPWYATASLNLLVCRYKETVTSTCYIALLVYWYAFISRNASRMTLFNELFFEITRSYTKRTIDAFGMHYSLNIVEKIVSGLIVWIGEVVNTPQWSWGWLPVIVAATALRFLFHSNVMQLWTQRQITRLARWNTNIWKLRGLALEHICVSILQSASNKFITVLIETTRSAIHYYGTCPPAMANIVIANFLSVIVLGDPLGQSNRFLACILLFYFLWFRDFANPGLSEHKYSPLENSKHIRVLLVYPRFSFQPIRCSLLEGPQVRLKFYEALSYTWGDTTVTEEILVDGCKRKVTKSLYEILASHSALLMPKLLWIDALCIDQENEAEKSNQVQLMKTIYLNALFVTVWLGHSPLCAGQGQLRRSPLQFRYGGVLEEEHTRLYFENARLAFDLLHELEVLQDALGKKDRNVYQDYERLKLLFTAKPQQWKAMLKLLRHPWFERVWVVQEIALAQSVQVRYGNEVISWNILAKGVEKLQSQSHFRLWLEWTHGVRFRYMQHTSLGNATRMDRFRKKVQGDGPHGSRYGSMRLAELLTESFYFKATNHRDLIFGFMGICSNPMTIAYSASVEQVYIEAAKALFESRNFGLLFHAAGVGRYNQLKTPSLVLPSWVPDWTNALRYERLHGFKAGGNSGPRIRITPDATLVLPGLLLDEILLLGPVLFDTQHQGGSWAVDKMCRLATNYFSFLAQLGLARLMIAPSAPVFEEPKSLSKNSRLLSIRLKRIREQLGSVRRKLGLPRGGPNSLEDAFRKMLVANKFANPYTKPNNSGYRDFVWEMKYTVWEFDLMSFLSEQPTSELGKSQEVYERLERMDETTQQVWSSCGGRRLFITKSGRIGLCPPFSREEDLIYVIPGLDTPLLLRRSKTVKAFVGECYVHGLMEGEAMSLGVEEELLEIV